MSTDRRTFVKKAGLAVVAAGMGVGASTAGAESLSDNPTAQDDLVRQGPKDVVKGKRAVASSQSAIVTQTMLDVMKAGGNAIDASVAGMITQATVQPEMTNHTGTVSFLYYEAKSGKIYQLNSMGTLVSDLPPFRPYPAALGGVSGGMACIPGFMPGVAAVHARFGTKPWKSLVEPAIPWAEDGFRVDEFQRAVFEYELLGNTFFPSMRELFAPTGFSPSVGELLKNPALAKTLRRLADTGPEYFTTGDWAKHFVAAGNNMGWKVKMEHMTATPPRWQEPLRFNHNGYEVVQLSPPERQGAFCSMVLGILRHLDIVSLGHYTESAESLYYFGHAMRRAEFEMGYLQDPEYFGQSVDIWTSDDFHARLAEIIKKTRPKAGLDLTRHVELTTARANLQAFGYATQGPNPNPSQPAGSCEITCVDPQGNWVQAMDTLQSGGIPGIVVDGVPMLGSHAGFTMNQFIQGWLGVPGSRMRSGLGNTIVLKNGKPVLSMGSPGNVHCTIPQVLSNILDYKMDPYKAVVVPRMLPMRDDYTIAIENRIPARVLGDLMKLGAKLQPLPPYDFHMGSFQQAWRDEKTGELSASTDPRRAGKAGGF